MSWRGPAKWAETPEAKRARELQERAGFQSVRCQTCAAAAGFPCIPKDGRPMVGGVHPERRRRAQGGW